MSLAILIPTLNAGEYLPELLSQLPDDLRIVISDGGSTDETLTIAAKAGAVLCLGTPGRGTQLRRGASWFAGAEHVLVVHADSVLPDGWRAAVDSFLNDHPDSVGYFRFGTLQSGLGAYIVRAWVDLRCWVWRLPYGDQGLVMHRDTYDELGGYADMPLFEDVEIADRIKAKLGRARFRPLPLRLKTDLSAHLKAGVWRRGWRNVQLLRAYRRGEPVESLRQKYK